MVSEEGSKGEDKLDMGEIGYPFSSTTEKSDALRGIVQNPMRSVLTAIT